MNMQSETSLLEKYMLDEGKKWDYILKLLETNMNRILKTVESGSRELHMHRIDGMSDKEKQLVELNKQAKKLKRSFFEVIYRIKELEEEE